MLQEVPGVTSAAALGVTQCYPSLRRLMEAYDEIEEDEGETLLEGCAVGTLATGVVTSRQLGQVCCSSELKADHAGSLQEGA